MSSIARTSVAIPAGERQRGERGVPIGELDLSVRTYNCLRQAGIDTLDVLARVSRETLLELPGVGRGSLDEIASALAEHGYSLATSADGATVRPVVRPTLSIASVSLGQCEACGCAVQPGAVVVTSSGRVVHPMLACVSKAAGTAIARLDTDELIILLGWSAQHVRVDSTVRAVEIEPSDLAEKVEVAA